MRRVVVPCAVLGVVVGSAQRVRTSDDTGIAASTWCWREQLISNAPPADVLLIGSSRSGRGIDPSLMAAELDDGATFERVTFGGSNEMERNLGVRTYLAHRGVPDTLVLELGFDVENPALPLDESADAPLLATTGARRQFDTRTYRSMVRDLRSDGTIGWDDQYVTSRVASPAGFWFETLQIGVDTALRHPSSVIARSTHECVPRTMVSGLRWIDGNSRTYRESSATLPAAEELTTMSIASAAAMSVDLDAPSTRQEVALVRDVLREARAAGVENVVLLYLPPFGDAADTLDIDDVARRFPDTDIFDARTVLIDDARPRLRMQYLNVTHLNVFAAHEVSVALADVIDTARSG